MSAPHPPPPPHGPYAGWPPAAAPTPTARPGDAIATLLVLGLGLVLNLGGSLVGFISIFAASTDCETDRCESSVSSLGLLAMLGPWVVFVIAMVVSLVRLTRGRRGWSIALVGVVGGTFVWMAAAFAAFSITP